MFQFILIVAGGDGVDVVNSHDMQYLICQFSISPVYFKVSNDRILDPAAGSGNLICSAINVFNVSASALKANDINKKLNIK